MRGFTCLTSLYNSSTLIWRLLAKNTCAMSSRCAVDLSPCLRKCSLKIVNRSDVCSAGRVTWSSCGGPRLECPGCAAPLGCRALGHRCSELRGCRLLEQLPCYGRQIHVIEWAPSEFLYKDFDLCAGRKTAVYEDHMCFADPATAAAHVIADLAQQLLFTHLEAEVCCRLLEFFQQRLLRPTPPHQLVHR